MILPLRYRAAWLAAAAVFAALIATGSLVPMGTVQVVNVWDKLQHGGGYFLLTLLLLGIVERRVYPAAALGALLFGGLLEIAQGLLTTTRITDWRDFFANATGIVAALCCAYLGLGGWAQRVEALLRVR